MTDDSDHEDSLPALLVMAFAVAIVVGLSAIVIAAYIIGRM